MHVCYISYLITNWKSFMYDMYDEGKHFSQFTISVLTVNKFWTAGKYLTVSKRLQNILIATKQLKNETLNY